MLGLTFHFCVPSIFPRSAIAMDHPSTSSSLHFSLLRSRSIAFRSRRSNSILISCHSSPDRFAHTDDDSRRDYFEASFLVTGEYAIEKLIDCQLGIENGDAPDLFQFIQDLIVKVGYQVTTARITERVMNTYFARLFLKKDGENETLSVDARPSDALNVAYRCKIPVLVSKQIVYEDAIRVSYGFGRVRERKSCYDVLLDSAADGPDFLSEELDMLKNMKMAIYEERYKDAALWRDKLTKLRKSEDEE